MDCQTPVARERNEGPLCARSGSPLRDHVLPVSTVSGHLPDQGAASADAAKASAPVCFWTSAFRPVLAVEYVRRSGYFAAEVEFANNRQLSPKPVNPLRARALGREQALRQTTVWGAEGRLRRFLAPSLTKHRKAGQGSPCAHLTGGG